MDEYKKITKKVLFSRLPIFDSNKEVFAYLINVNGDEFGNSSDFVDDQEDFQENLDVLLINGLDSFFNGKRAYACKNISAVLRVSHYRLINKHL